MLRCFSCTAVSFIRAGMIDGSTVRAALSGKHSRPVGYAKEGRNQLTSICVDSECGPLQAFFSEATRARVLFRCTIETCG
jgi:hypothetical protein